MSRMSQPFFAYSPAGDAGSITRVAGIEVGHCTDTRRPTGCSVVIAREGAVAGVDVRGAAPGTRETDLLEPTHLVERIHAVMLAGGSAFGLDAASGAVRWLEERGIGLDVGVARIPLVPAAVLFDLPVGDARIRPDAAAGYAACGAASREDPAEGNVGAGAGAAVGAQARPDESGRGQQHAHRRQAQHLDVGVLRDDRGVGGRHDDDEGQRPQRGGAARAVEETQADHADRGDGRDHALGEFGGDHLRHPLSPRCLSSRQLSSPCRARVSPCRTRAAGS